MVRQITFLKDGFIWLMLKIDPLQDPGTWYGINYACWDTSNAVGLRKQTNSYQSNPAFLVFESPIALFASQHNLFSTMWPDHAKGLFQDTDKVISIRANLFQLNQLTSGGQTSNLKLHLDVCDKYRTILGCSSSRLIECVHSSSSDKSNLFTSDHQTVLGDNSGF